MGRRSPRRPPSRHDPREPALRCFDLTIARQRLGTFPQTAERGRAAGRGDRRHEPLALAVLLHLQVHAGKPHDRSLEGAAVLSPLVEALADPLDLGHEITTDLRSEEHTSELQSPMYLVCRLL